MNRSVSTIAFVASAAGFFLTGAFGVAAAFAVFIATNFLTTFIALGMEAFAAFIATSFLTTFIAVRTLAVFAAVIWRVIAFIAMAMGLWDCVAASASAFGARHACCVCAFFFFVMYNADSASTDIVSASSLCISGRSPNQHHSKNNDIEYAFGGSGEVDAR